jgi:hypothetical protein
MVTDNTYKRMVVTGNTVHIAVSYYEGSWYGVLGYLRSTDNGVSFESIRNLFTAAGAFHVYDVRVAASEGKVSIGFRNQCNWLVDNGYYIFNSDDGGDTFTQHTVYSTTTGSGWKVSDLQRVGDRIYVAYTDSYSYYGLQYSRLYLAASGNAGDSFTSTLISIPSNNEAHKTYPLQDNHYVPKIAGVGDTVTVIWNGLDADDVHSVFIRRSTDSGANFGEVRNLTRGVIPEGKALAPGQETLTALGNYVYSLFVTTAWDVYLRRSTDNGANFLGLQVLNSTTSPYISQGWWAVIKTDPTVPSGAKVHVLWTYPTYVYSLDGGATFTKPELVSPYFSYSGAYPFSAVRPQMAISQDGSVHFTVEAHYYSSTFGGYGDMDIFYRVLGPVASPFGVNNGLHLYSDTNDARWDNMQVRASNYLNFTSQMTGEVWVRPYAGGPGTGSSSYVKPIFHKVEAGYKFAYALQTWDRYGLRQAQAQIKTTDGEFWVNPAGSTEGLVPDDSWSHLAFTYDAAGGSDNFKLYLNGQLIASTTATGNIATGDGLFFAGYYGIWDITELRLWNRVRTQEELAATMYQSVNRWETGLNAYYTFKNTTGDLTGHGNDGILMYKEQYIQQDFIVDTKKVLPGIHLLLLN